MTDEDDREWCSIYGYVSPQEHVCAIGICYNPYRDGQELRGTVEDRETQAKMTL